MTANIQPPHVLLEGTIKFRDNKKWKTRWAVVCKLSPVADCLHVNLYSSYNDKTRNVLPKRTVLLQSAAYLGIESGFTLQNESNTLAIVCRDATLVIALETREIMHQWQTKLQYQFCKEHHFVVHIVSLPPKSNLSCGPARMLLSASCFCLVTGIPPRLLGFWQMEHLRRFGAVDGKFCFEGGSQCGKGMGLHVLYSNQADEISKYFELASCGQLHSANLQTSDCDGYYRKSSRESLLYKYANVGGSSANGKSEVHKSNSSDSSSTCDSCSHVLSLTCDDTHSSSRSTYYLNQADGGSGSKCNTSGNMGTPPSSLSLYHSSINLNCHDQMSLHKGKVFFNGGGDSSHLQQQQQPHQHGHNQHHHQRHGSICNANAVECQCQCSGGGGGGCGATSLCNRSLHRASTISRLSTVKCDHSLTKTSSIHCPLSFGEQYSGNHQLPPTAATAAMTPSLPSPSDTLKAYSPSAVSLASQCTANFIASDRESIFSHSSQGSSSSSSGCSSLTCGADQSGSNGSSGSSSTTHHHHHHQQLHPWRSQVQMPNIAGYKFTEVGNATALRHITVTAAADPVRPNLDEAVSCPSGVNFCQQPTVHDDFIGCSSLSMKPNNTNDGSHCEVLCEREGTSRIEQSSSSSTIIRTTNTTAGITQKWSHLYSQINFIKQQSSETRQMANYDIPRNLCVNVAFSNQKAAAAETVAGEAKPATTSTAINHCYCDTASAEAVAQAVVQSTSAGGNSEQQRQQQTRDQCSCSESAGALNADSIKHHELAAVNGRNIFGSVCPQPNCALSDSSSTLIRRHTKPAHQQQHFLSAAVADNESSIGAAQQCYISHRKDADQPQLNGCCGGCGAAQWTIDSRVPGGSCGQKPAKHETVSQPNYANMQFINSIELYENLRFTQPALRQPQPNHQHSNNRSSNGNRINHDSDSNEPRHSIVGDESTISVTSGEEESKKQSSNSVSFPSPSRNCPSHPMLNRQEEHHCAPVPNGADSSSSSSSGVGDELLTDSNGSSGHDCESDAISKQSDTATESKSMNDSHENGNAHCQTASASTADVDVCSCDIEKKCCTATTANNDEQWNSKMERNGEGGEGEGRCTRLNGSNSLTGLSSTSIRINGERANNGGHYLRHHHHHWVDGQLEDARKNVNISLSSLHNRTSWRQSTTAGDCRCSPSKTACCSCTQAKWSESNAIRRTHHLRSNRSQSRWRRGGGGSGRRRMPSDRISRSYSLEDFSTSDSISTGCQCSSSSTCTCADKDGRQPPLEQLPLPLDTSSSGHTATRQSGRFSWPNLEQLDYQQYYCYHFHCQGCCTESSSKDFCTSSQQQQQHQPHQQLTVAVELCQPQTESV